ncbi:hypothetical protein GCM10009536_17730 [Streptomyces thermocarboxydus]
MAAVAPLIHPWTWGTCGELHAIVRYGGNVCGLTVPWALLAQDPPQVVVAEPPFRVQPVPQRDELAETRIHP